MNRTYVSVGSILALMLAAASPKIQAQAAPDASASATTSASASTDDQTIELSPFVVSSSEGKEGYMAETTLAGSRVRTDLKDIGSAINVVTKKFMQDIGASDNQSLLQYTTNTEVGGVYGNFAGMGNSGQLDESNNLLKPNNNTRVRGLDAADNTRDFFLTDIPWDGFNVDRVEIQRGANSILFGVGSPAGIINTTLSSASFKNANKIENRVGSYGSLRDTLDINYVILKNQLAVRLMALDDKEKYQQKPAFNHDKRVYVALRYDPKFLQTDSSHFSLRANFEDGHVRGNRPRTLPPIDAITPWWLTGAHNLNHQLYNPFVEWKNPPSGSSIGGTASTASSNYIPWYNEAFMGREFNSDVGLVYNAGSNVPSNIQQPNMSTIYGISSTGSIDGGIDGIPFFRELAIAGYNSYSRGEYSGLPGANYNVYKDKSLTDPSVFDFYNKLIDGPNKKEWNDWEAFTIDASQTLFDNKLAFDLAYNHQKYMDGQESFLNGEQYVLSVDINSVNVDGTPNPNAGRPYVGNSGLYGNGGNIIERNNIHLTGTLDLQASDFLGKNLLSDILGRQTLTGLLSEEQTKSETRSWDRWAASLDWAKMTGQSLKITDGARQVDFLTYLGPSLANASSAAGANLGAVSTFQAPAAEINVNYFDSHWNHSLNPTDPSYIDPAAPYTLTDGSASHQSENPANYVGWVSTPVQILSADNGDINQLYWGGGKKINKVDSQSLVWQSFFYHDLIANTLSYRHDTVRLWSNTAPLDPVTGVASMDYGYGPLQSKQSGESKSWSIVLHTPKFIRQKLPGNTDISFFYNNSQNFKADTARVDIEGRNIPNAKGKTIDYGFVISALNDKVKFKVNWYKNTEVGATLQGAGAGIGGNLYYLYLLEAWGTASAGIDARGLAGQIGTGGAWYWDWSWHDNNTTYGLTPRDASTAATDAKELAAVSSWVSQMPSQQFFDNYGLPVNVAAIKAGDWVNGLPTYGNWNVVNVGGLQSSTGGTIHGLSPSATVDTISKGIEFELTTQLTKNWSLAVNASKTNATRQNLSSTLADFITYQHNVFYSPAGDLRLWWAGDNTLGTYWKNNIEGPYQFLVSQQGTAAPEISPWHFNVITNYEFDHGPVKGMNVGAAYRWQDGQILGYGLDANNNYFPDVTKAIRGKAEDYVDLWVGYQHKLTSRLDWRIQLNLKNVGTKAHLVPISVQPDGSPAAFRIQDGMQWQLTNSFMF